ncbi:hypothetical protein IHE45_05G168100 [Dioscorea alata]|uniref:Uncharacterized protein n=1 Tax=Dioscorea alata TaxID=55571 RepID=A0ACB7W671_DIOAL|nr:hypothetical protein IHE45_05G168100 [Dioscorea alata]
MEKKDVDNNNKVELELVHIAIQQLLDERKKNKKGLVADEDEDESKLLCKLLTQLELLEKDHKNGNKEETSRNSGENDVRIDEVVKEIKGVKRQNKITHCLLSVLIIATAFWQLSEVSILLAVKEKLSNPVKAIGDLFKGVLKGQNNKPLTEPPPMHPQLPHVNIPALSLNNNAGHRDGDISE